MDRTPNMSAKRTQPGKVLSMAATGLLTAAVFTTSLEAQNAPPDVRIVKVTPLGNGCPEGSISTYLSEDGKVMTVIFDQFATNLENRNRASKTCELFVEFESTPGWEYALFCLDYAGFADLDRGIQGVNRTQYRYLGPHSHLLPLGDLVLNGPYNGAYSKRSLLPIGSRQFSGCRDRSGRSVLQLQTVAEVSRSSNRVTGSGVLMVDTLDGEISHHYALDWRKCDNDDGQNPGTIQHARLDAMKAATMHARAEQERRDGKPAQQLFANHRIANRTLVLAQSNGISANRVRHGRIETSMPCPENWKFHVKDANNQILNIGTEEFFSLQSGVTLPRNAHSLWVGFDDSAYFDNKGMGGTRTPRSGSTNGCNFEFRLHP